VGDRQRLKCNDPSRSSLAAITDEEWDSLETDERIPEGEVVEVGFDCACKWDCAALAPLWMPHLKTRFSTTRSSSHLRATGR
jgi:hypothetical protein